MNIIKKIGSGVLIAVALEILICCVVIPLFQRKLSQPVLPSTRLTQPQDSGERIRCIDDNVEALVRRLQVIETAKENLIFTTFNYSDDESGRDIMAALLHAADRGVNVRILVDGICALTSLNGSKLFRTLANSERVEVRIYNPVNLLEPWRWNYRMHDKYIVADDQVYILGGRNTKNLSLGNYQPEKDFDRDVLVFNAGQQSRSSLSQVKAYFESVWNLQETKPYAVKDNPDPTVLKELRDYYEYMRDGCPEVFCAPDWQKETVLTQGISLLTNSPSARNKEPLLWECLVQLMQQGEDVLVQTPYLICNGKMYQDLENTVERCGSLEILTNAVESGGNLCGCADYLNQKGRIRKIGAEIYEFSGEHSSHSKTILIDDRISIIGSFNFDMRSTYLDTEMMLVIQSPELNDHLRQVCREFQDQSRWIMTDGATITGPLYIHKQLSLSKWILYSLLRIVIIPLRHLL